MILHMVAPDADMSDHSSRYHYHEDEKGILHRCYHKTRISWKAWVLAATIATLGFPIEHTIWEKVPPFSNIADRIGLIDHGAHSK